MSTKKNSQNLRMKQQMETLEERVLYLEQVNRLTLDALDQAARLGDFQTSINQLDSPISILEKTHERIRSLIPFESVAFYLVNEEDAEFYLAECQPEGMDRFIKVEVETAIENGTFAWAIREQRPIFFSNVDHTKKILFHVLTTSSRVRGMFVGVLNYGEMEVPLVSLSLMSIILRHSANALESFELYGMIRKINKNLEVTVEKRTSELERSQEQFRHVQKMEALGRLAGGVAHDFNNVLTAITIASEVSLQDPSINDAINQSFNDILKAAERAAGLTRQLLAVSRKQVIKPRLMDINSVVLDIKHMLSRLITEDIEISLKAGKDLHPIKADSSQIEQVLINLAINAQHAIAELTDPYAEKSINIQLMEVNLGSREMEQNIVSKPGFYILIRFSDTGVGMKDSVRQRIFDPFFTTKAEGKGTGLGLATVYGIIKQNNGGITVKSEPGKGSTFDVYWPCAELPVDVILTSPKTNRVQGGEETILLVEDDEGIRGAVERLLTSLGYHVIPAINGKDALDCVENYEEDVHLLLTDITMPVMDGIQLAKTLKQKKPDIKIIFTTGYIESPQASVEPDALPFDSWFIRKPYSISEVTKMVRQLLDQR
jgi:signal transduction histidine kinase/CheY-like chemotaxis protein